MGAGGYDTQITIQKRFPRQESQYGTDNGPWQSIHGSGRLWAKVDDSLPSRSEQVRQGLAIARNQTRIRLRYRADVTSDMRVIIHRDTDSFHPIIGGPAEIGGRKRELEIVVEQYSSGEAT